MSRVGWYGEEVEGVGVEFVMDIEAAAVVLAPIDARRLALCLLEVANTIDGLRS
jgi:predicted aspartyl protease